MKKDYTKTFILNALGLPVIKDFHSLSSSMRISENLLFLLTNATNQFYTPFIMPKGNGASRTIDCPSSSLKLVQRWILEEILSRIQVSPESMAFEKEKGILQNAEQHKFSLYILQLDLKNFFPSINRNRVFYLFKELGYNNQVSGTLANLCTYKGYLPQGSPSSPYISNLICYKLDKRLKGLCSKRDIVYTRYADDLSFSCDNVAPLRKLYNVIEEIIVNEGFELNKSKTRLISPSGHKKVTGLTITSDKYHRIRAKREIKKKARAMFHRSFVSADYSNIEVIRGYVAYVNSIEKDYKERFLEYVKGLVNKDYYRHIKEIVDAFNKNKIFKELSDMKFKEVEPFDEFTGYDIYLERDCYLYNKGLISEDPLKSYDESASTDESDDESEFPF